MKLHLRKWMALILAAVLAAGTAGCGSVDTEAIRSQVTEAINAAAGSIAGVTETEVVAEEAEAVEEAEVAEETEAVEKTVTAEEIFAEPSSSDSETMEVPSELDDFAKNSALEDAEIIEEAEAVEEAELIEEAEAVEEAELIEEAEAAEEAELIEEAEAAEGTEEAEASGIIEGVTRLIPAVGEEVAGFTTDSVTDLTDGSRLITLTHGQSGATVVFVAADAEDCALDIFVRTPSVDDRGTAHVLEHLILAGSERYMSAPALYYTDLESDVCQHVTSYGASSLSPDELLTAFDYYMSSLTDPVGFSDELYLKELRRYELESPESELIYTGDVVEELRAEEGDGAAKALRETLKLLYPYSTMSYDGLGTAAGIADISMDELKDYYDTYYQPSNMLIVLYGALDIREYLELLSEDYLSDYEALDIETADAGYLAWEGYRKASVEIPQDAGAKGRVTYAISLGELSFYERELLDALAGMLNQEKSPLTEAVEEAFPDSTFGAYVYNEYAIPVWTFELSGVKDPDADKFKKTVDDAIEMIAGEGIDQLLIDGYINRAELRNATAGDEPIGADTCLNIGLVWGAGGDPSEYADMYAAKENLRDEADAGTLDTLLNELILYPDTSVLLTVDPVPEREEIAEADPLDSMTISEIVALIGETAEFHAWKELMSIYDIAFASETLEPEPELKPGEPLGESIDISELYEESDELEGVNAYVYSMEGADYLGADIYLDAETLDFDEIHDFAFLGALLKSLPTAESTPDEIDDELFSLGSSLNFTPEVLYDDLSGDPHPYLGIHMTALGDKIDETWALMEEILSSTDFSDTERIGEIAAETADDLKEYLEEAHGSYRRLSAEAAEDSDKLYEYYAFYDEYLDYLEKAAGYGPNKLKRLGVRLEAVLSKLTNVNGLIYTACGSEETLGSGYKLAETWIAGLDTEELEAVDYSEELAKYKPEAAPEPEPAEKSGTEPGEKPGSERESMEKPGTGRPAPAHKSMEKPGPESGRP